MNFSVLDELAYRIFGAFFYKNKEYFQGLKAKIRESHIPMSVDQYLASAGMYSLVSGLLGGVFGAWLGLKMFIEPVSRFSFTITSANMGFSGEHPYILGFSVSLLFLFLITFTVFGIIYSIPYLQADIRHACIDKSMLSSVTYMYALTKGGMSIYDVFRSLSMYTHIFGASSEEISYIVRDMDYLGKDFISALTAAKERTPSEIFKDFIDGLILVSSSQAIVEYIKNKSEQYQNMAELANKNFLKRLDVLAEIYVTVMVAGPLFIMTTLVVLQLLRPASAHILYILIYVVTPLATLLFLVVLDTIGELSVNPKKTNASDFHAVFSDVPEIESRLSEEEEKEKSERFMLHRKLSNIKDMILNPYRTIRDEPRYTFFFGIPMGLYYLLLITKNITEYPDFNFHFNLNFDHISTNSVQLITEFDDYFVIFFVIILIPYIVFYEIKAWRMRKIDERMPDFLRNLSSMNQSGILLSNSLKIMAESKMGILTQELKKLKEDLSWGTSTSRALLNLENNIRTAASSRVLHILIKANESTSDIKNVLFITSEQIKIEEDMKKERSSDMVVYVVTIYVAFFVFLFIVYILAMYFFPQTTAFTSSSKGAASAGFGNSFFNIHEYTMLMYHSALIQAFTSGLVAGKMGQGSVYMGLKYSVSMMIITYIVFTMFV